MADILVLADARLVKQNPYFAQLYYAAGRLGRADAQFDLGNFFFDGEHVPQDTIRAQEWYRLAAENGHLRARFFLGVICLMGIGGAEKNGVEARKWLTLAAEEGYLPAQYNLGIMLMNGDGVPQDALGARHWLSRAAEQGYRDAESALEKLAGYLEQAS